VLADATGNRHLSRYLLHLHQVATRFNLAAWKRDRNAKPSITEHRQIVAIMRQRDVEEAKSVMRAHIENARGRIVGTMADIE
jgi:DNA-binding FadR family transcriptional regulator